MRLVIDANILVASLLKDAATREILLEENIEFFAPEYLLTEIKAILENSKIRKRIPLSDKDLSELTQTLLSRITFVPERAFLSYIRHSMSIVTHIEDAPYHALSLALKTPLWSNDTALKNQSSVRVYTTSELLRSLAQE